MTGSPPPNTILISLTEGKYIDLLKPDPDVIEIEQIAHRLANLCRWLGATKHFYSVAQHSLILSYLVPQELALQALLHDATEAYMGDLVTPLKVHFPEFAKMEDNLWSAIADKFYLPHQLDPLIRVADKRLGLTEKRELVGPGPAYHSDNHQPYSGDEFQSISGFPFDGVFQEFFPHDIETEFLGRYARLVHDRAVT